MPLHQIRRSIGPRRVKGPASHSTSLCTLLLRSWIPVGIHLWIPLGILPGSLQRPNLEGCRRAGVSRPTGQVSKNQQGLPPGPPFTMITSTNFGMSTHVGPPWPLTCRSKTYKNTLFLQGLARSGLQGHFWGKILSLRGPRVPQGES